MRTAYSEYGVGHHRLAAAATPERSLTFNVVHFAIVGGKRALVAAEEREEDIQIIKYHSK